MARLCCIISVVSPDIDRNYAKNWDEIKAKLIWNLILALDFESVVAGVSIELGAFARCSRRYKYRLLKQFLVIADTGDPFSKFLGDCVTVLIALSAVEYCDSCACPAGRNADSSFDGCVHDLLPDVARLLGQGDHSRLNCAELRIFLRRMMSSLLQETG